MAKYGFYSEKQRNKVGYAYYKCPDGSSVTVTMVVENINHEAPQYDDIKFVGEVTDLVQSFWYPGKDESPDTKRSGSERKTDPAIMVPETKICPWAYYGVRPCTCGMCRCPPERVTNDPYGYHLGED